MKLLHAADLHIDSPLRGLSAYEGAPAEELRTASRRALENLVALAISESVDGVLLAGDIYDGDWPDFQTGLFFGKQMSLPRPRGHPRLPGLRQPRRAEPDDQAAALPDNVHMLDINEPQTIRDEARGWPCTVRASPSATSPSDLALAYPDAAAATFSTSAFCTPR